MRMLDTPSATVSFLDLTGSSARAAGLDPWAREGAFGVNDLFCGVDVCGVEP